MAINTTPSGDGEKIDETLGDLEGTAHQSREFMETLVPGLREQRLENEAAAAAAEAAAHAQVAREALDREERADTAELNRNEAERTAHVNDVLSTPPNAMPENLLPEYLREDGAPNTEEPENLLPEYLRENEDSGINGGEQLDSGIRPETPAIEQMLDFNVLTALLAAQGGGPIGDVGRADSGIRPEDQDLSNYLSHQVGGGVDISQLHAMLEGAGMDMNASNERFIAALREGANTLVGAVTEHIQDGTTVSPGTGSDGAVPDRTINRGGSDD